MYASMSVVSALFMEITKITDISIGDDIGKGRMDMAKVRAGVHPGQQFSKFAKFANNFAVQGTFYQNVFVYGDCVQMRYAEEAETRTQAGAWVYGVPVHELVSNMIKKRDIKINYTLLCEHMKQAKLLANPETVCSLIRSIGMEETVPAWEINKWASVTKHYYQCEMFEYADVTQFDEGKELRVVFTHQLSGHDSGNTMATRFRDQIERVLNNGEAPAVTALHCSRLVAPFEQLVDPTSGPNPLQLDVAATNAKLHGLKDLVRLEKVYYCMESCVAVVIVSKKHLESVKTMLTNWSGAIQAAQKQRCALLYNHYLSHPYCLKPGVVLHKPN